MVRTRFIFALFIFIISITFVLGLPTCSDSNEIDVSTIPCNGLTVPINCADNVTILNATNSSDNQSIPTSVFSGAIYNFTINLSRGSYQIIDCQNNTATVLVGLFEQGYGINMFGVIFPAVILSFITLFISGRIFKKRESEDEEDHEQLEREENTDSFIPKSRLIPIVFMLLSFVPLIFMVGFVSGHMEEYLASANVTTFYGMYYTFFAVIFYVIFLISFIVWLSSYIERRKISKGIIEGVE